MASLPPVGTQRVINDVVYTLSANSDVPYRATLAEAIAEFPVGYYFKTDDKAGVGPHPGELWIYQRTAGAPGYVAQVVATASTVEINAAIAEANAAAQVALATTAALAAPTGASLVSYAADFVPSPQRPLNKVFDDVVLLTNLGVSPEIADNSVKLAEIFAKASDIAMNYAVPPRIIVPSGQYEYSVSPNFAAQGLHLDCQPGAIFHHTGSGRAFIVDGGETGGGIGMMKVTGGLVIRGNPNTTDGMYNRAVHHSTFDVEVQSVSVAALRTEWVVCNEYWFRCSPVLRPFFNPVPLRGIVMDRRGVGERSSRCTFHNPILEGINGYGITLESAIITTFLGGTSESNVAGAYIGPDSSGNIFDGVDFEFNTSMDVYNLGQYNSFRNCLSDLKCEFSGIFNNIGGGLFNSVVDSGERNSCEDFVYGIGGGDLTRSNSGNYRNLRSALDHYPADIMNGPIEKLVLGSALGPANTGLLASWASSVAGGDPNDWYEYKYGDGTKRIFGGPLGDRFAHGSDGTAFNGVALIGRRPLPAAATDAATTMALANAMRQYLIDHGQCS